MKADFIVTVAHRERGVEVWNEQLSRWEPITIGELMQRVLWRGTLEARFERAGRQEQRTLPTGACGDNWGLAKVWQALVIGPVLGLQPALGPSQPTYYWVVTG